MSNTTRIGTSNGRGLSPALWRPNLDQLRNSDAGFVFEDDFMDLPTGKYTATQATAGTFALGDAAGGVALADCNSTTATQGINVQVPAAGFLPVASDDIYFEARVKAADIATGPEFFLGLSEVDTSVIGTSANTSANHIGFESVTDDGVILFHSESAGTRSSMTVVHTLVDDEWVKLGFRVSGTGKIEVFVNGVKDSQTITSNVPVVALAPTLVCQSGGTTDPIVHIDQLTVAQVIGS